jgi:starvation-inducible outer membrane lipoprotein
MRWWYLILAALLLASCAFMPKPVEQEPQADLNLALVTFVN